MDGKKANLIVTDPPYGVSFKSGSGLSIQNDSMKGDEFYTFLYNLSEQVKRLGSRMVLVPLRLVVVPDGGLLPVGIPRVLAVRTRRMAYPSKAAAGFPSRMTA